MYMRTIELCVWTMCLSLAHIHITIALVVYPRFTCSKEWAHETRTLRTCQLQFLQPQKRGRIRNKETSWARQASMNGRRRGVGEAVGESIEAALSEKRGGWLQVSSEKRRSKFSRVDWIRKGDWYFEGVDFHWCWIWAFNFWIPILFFVPCALFRGNTTSGIAIAVWK